MASIFLSHSSKDKEFTRELHNTLIDNGIESWIDEAEIKMGDSLIGKIEEGLKVSNHIAIILSPNSINSPWVEKELEMAIALEIKKDVKIIPILIENCEIPLYLQTKKYGDFRTSSKALNGIRELLSILENSKKIDKAKGKFLTKKEINTSPQKKEKSIGHFKELFEYAIDYDGLRMPRYQAVEFTTNFLKSKNTNIKKFKELFEYAIDYDGLRMPRYQAVEFALNNMNN